MTSYVITLIANYYAIIFAELLYGCPEITALQKESHRLLPIGWSSQNMRFNQGQDLY